MHVIFYESGKLVNQSDEEESSIEEIILAQRDDFEKDDSQGKINLEGNDKSGGDQRSQSQNAGLVEQQ